MTKNPFVNALSATAYISAIALMMRYGPQGPGADSSFIAPIAFLSLFVLSAALMGYFFLYQPLRLFFEQKPQEATKLFLQTVLVFACITAATLAVWLLLATQLS